MSGWLLRVGGVRVNVSTLRTATVKAVAQKQALEGEGKAFVGVGGRKGLPSSRDRVGLGFTQVGPDKLSLHVNPAAYAATKFAVCWCLWWGLHKIVYQ